MRFALLFLFVLLFCQNHAQVCHSFDPTQLDSIIAREQSFKTTQNTPIVLAPTSNYDIVYHRIAVSVNPAIRYISGTVVSYFKPLMALNVISFDLTDSLTVDSVSYHGFKQPITHSGGALTIFLPTFTTSLDSLTIYYRGIPPTTGFGSFNIATHDTMPVLWTLSEPYGARDWLPCKMTLTDKVDSIDFYITVPKGNRAASNGLLINIDSLSSITVNTFHWQHRYPIATYLMAIAVTNYAAYSFIAPTAHGNINILNYIYPEKTLQWHEMDTNVIRFIELYSSLFGTYPFIKEKYGHAQFGWGGGMEHQTMSFVAGPDFELLAHEMAHQWFGDKLTCGSWADIWLNEGFATYLSGLCYEHIAPEWWYAYKQDRNGKVIKYGSHGTVWCDDTTSVPRIFSNIYSYAKGACLLHMLRWTLGDTDFFQAIYNYVNDPALIYSFSKTALLQQHLESQSGKDLRQFFDQWFYKQGYPSYQLDWAQQGNSLSFKLSQTTTDTSVRFFAMSVPIKLYGNGIDTTLKVENTENVQYYAYTVPFAIDSIVIDPTLWILSGNNNVRKLPALDHDGFITIYPNPMHDIITVWYDAQTLNHLSYTVYNIEGQQIDSGLINGNNDKYSISVSDLASGVYVLQLSGTNTFRKIRLVKY